ncbi:MAG: hypothetical protein ACTSW1_03635 [Candidatus Hodarchaeales archaeon]
MPEDRLYISQENVEKTHKTNENILDVLDNLNIIQPNSSNYTSTGSIDQHDQLVKESSFNKVLDTLSEIETNLNIIKKQRPDFQPPRKPSSAIEIDNIDILSQLGTLVRPCKMCGTGVLRNELINGLCLECHNKKELAEDTQHLVDVKSEIPLAPLLKRIKELETQIKDLESKLNSTIQSSPSIRVPPRPSSNVPPPPPPPSSQTTQQSSIDINDLDFEDMTLEELSSLNAEILENLSLSQRNQYNNRLKELQELEKMSPEERAEYLKKKELEKEQKSSLNELRDALKNLEELGNPLFLKMKEQAENSVIVGQGTFGHLGPKKIFVPCYKCGATNELFDDEELVCKHCGVSLETR